MQSTAKNLLIPRKHSRSSALIYSHPKPLAHRYTSCTDPGIPSSSTGITKSSLMLFAPCCGTLLRSTVRGKCGSAFAEKFSRSKSQGVASTRKSTRRRRRLGFLVGRSADLPKRACRVVIKRVVRLLVLASVVRKTCWNVERLGLAAFVFGCSSRCVLLMGFA